jgi:diguanylate cyclase (GGDEF)-like protein
VTGGYLLVTALLTALTMTGWRGVAVSAFGTALIVDGVYLQVAHEWLGHTVSIDVALAAYVVAACLLGSFRTGLKVGVWQSLLMVIALRCEESGLVPAAAGLAGVDREPALIRDLVLIWFVVMITSIAASLNERELRRRRYDTEALERLATGMLADHRSQDVMNRLVDFLAEEMSGCRAVVVRRLYDDGNRHLELMAQAGTAEMTGGGQGRPATPYVLAAGGSSAFLDLAEASDSYALALRLNPEDDPALAAVLPAGRRLVAARLRTETATRCPLWLVVEMGAVRGFGSRVEQRSLDVVTQAAALAAISLSRAELLEQAERDAFTDGLTGLANRRAFDAALRTLEQNWLTRSVPYGVVLAELDHFRSVNDRFGRLTGDRLLQAVAAVFADVTDIRGARTTDAIVAARYVDDGFALLVPGATPEQVLAYAERIRGAIRGIDDPMQVSASFGVATVSHGVVTEGQTGGSTADDVVFMAGAALLRAKALGRDRVVTAEDTIQAVPVR